MEASSQTFLERNNFLIRRLHSLSGLIPVGAYMVVHLLTNASVIEGPGAFQSNVYRIHSLGGLLPLVEWVFIFIPILFHAIVGIALIAGSVPNTTAYPYRANWQYTLQRTTGMIAFVFIMWHVFHMHGWFHQETWLKEVAQPYGGAKFRPYNATSTAGEALQGLFVAALYAIGVLSCVYHLANGIWTSGITWGVWTSQRAQDRALAVCGVFGILLAIVGLGALGGMRKYGAGKNLEQAIRVEDQMYRHRVEAGEMQPNEHKRSPRGEANESDVSPVAETAQR